MANTENITINTETISRLLDAYEDAVSTFEKAEKMGSSKADCYRTGVIAIEKVLNIIGIDWADEEQAEEPKPEKVEKVEKPTVSDKRIYKNEIMVAEREDMSYSVFFNTYKNLYFAEVHYRSKDWPWSTHVIGNEKGYKTERGAFNAIKRHAEWCGKFDWAPSTGATLVF